MLDAASVASEAQRLIASRARLAVGLSDGELGAIVAELGRAPTDVELYAFDAQWSEHCSYKSSRRHLRKLPTDGPTVMQGPAEDAGIVRLGEWQGDAYGVVIAHESHNHPSQVVPFEGAATGIGGIVRDVLCMGAEVIAVADPLRFGRLDDPHCRYVAQSVVDGIAAYGNAIGVPNIGGDVYFDESFNDNVLVNVVALGLVKQQDIIHSRAPAQSAGYDIVLVGKATDRSGFGGASFSSLTLDEADAQHNKGAVQVPDPFLKSVIMRASYRVFEELRQREIVAGFKDLGAGGLAGCSAELVAAGGFGAEIDLDCVPTSQPDLPAAVIAIGETQERLCWVVPPAFTPELLRIYNDEYTLPQIAQGAGATVIGKVTDGGRYVARHRGDVVMDVPLKFLIDGVRYNRPYFIALPDTPVSAARSITGEEPERRPLGEIVTRIVAHRDVCSRRPIFERFDAVVRGTTVIPAGYADAGVIAPLFGAPLGVALAVAGNPRYGKIDAQRAAELAVVSAAARVAAVGARPVGLTDCLNFGDPTEPRQLGNFVAAVDGLAYAARELGTPFVSGNVSLYNQSKAGHAVAPSPIVACVGAIADISKTATLALKRTGSTLFVLDGPVQAHFGGSVYAELIGLTGSPLPVPDYAAIRSAFAFLSAAFERNLVLAAHAISDGGLLTALAEMAFGSLEPVAIGIYLAAPETWRADRTASVEAALFAEAGGFVIEAADAVAFAALARAWDVDCLPIATTTEQTVLGIAGTPDRAPESIDLALLRDIWAAPLSDFYGSAA